MKKILFSDSPAVIGMIHVGALPGTPSHTENITALCDAACRDAEIYARCGIDAVLVENMHDTPYTKTAGPEITAAMAVVTEKIRSVFGGPVGIQILAGANKEALAAALASGCRFIRVEGFVFGHLADEGWIDACAGELLRYRRHIGAEHINIFADIKKKHSSHAASADVSLEETAHAAEFFNADGVIVTGIATGYETLPDDVARVRKAVSLPVLVGSGVTADNIHQYRDTAHAVIVGSYIKKDGKWYNSVDETRVKKLLQNKTHSEV